MTIRKATYRAAQKVAETIEEHFSNNLVRREVKEGGGELAPIPKSMVIETILDTAFWASLRREEGYIPKLSLALLPPEKSKNPLLFSHRQRLSSETLIKLSAGVERAGIHLGVWHEEENLYIWGATRIIPDNCFVLDVSEPGLLVIKHRRVHGFGKFSNVAVLIGDQIKLVNKDFGLLPDCPELIMSLLGSTSNYDFTLNVMIQLAVSIRLHKRGGILLIVPSGSQNWKSSIVHPIHYGIDPVFFGLARLMQQDIEERGRPQWQGAVSKEVETIAGLTAIDGATVMNDKFELLAFGAKIKLADANSQVKEIVATEPIVGSTAKIINPSQNGGTRHFSAAQFVHDQRNAVAFVASQDGRFTIFTWSPCENMVQAHRIDTLLL